MRIFLRDQWRFYLRSPFPGVFSRDGLLGAYFQSAAWIYNFWHYGFPLAVTGNAILIGRDERVSRWSARFAIGCSAVIVLALVAALTFYGSSRVSVGGFLPKRRRKARG
ncbi:MAG: MASE4 domain-containing protein [Bradyrhizobium sp.]|nr:MASE4 domain-containing protein [Bradyrhizobium sp.]